MTTEDRHSEIGNPTFSEALSAGLTLCEFCGSESAKEGSAIGCISCERESRETDALPEILRLNELLRIGERIDAIGERIERIEQSVSRLLGQSGMVDPSNRWES